MKYGAEITGRITRYIEQVSHALKEMQKGERDEILANIESHIYEELSGKGESPTLQDLEAIFAEMDSPASYAGTLKAPKITRKDPTMPAVPQKKKSVLAIVSLIASCACFIGLGPLGSLIGIIFGHLALREIKSNANIEGAGLAKAGLILGYLGVLLTLCIALIFLIFMAVSF